MINPLKIAVLTLSLSLPATAVAAAEFPLQLVEPTSGSRVEVPAGARALHVVFFATWCPPCVEELEGLADLEARWRDRGYRLVIVAVSSRQSTDRLAAFAGRRAVPGQLLFDADGSVERGLAGTGVPGHLVFDATGKEVMRRSALDRELRDGIERMLVAGRPARRP